MKGRVTVKRRRRGRGRGRGRGSLVALENQDSRRDKAEEVKKKDVEAIRVRSDYRSPYLLAPPRSVSFLFLSFFSAIQGALVYIAC